MRGTIRGIGLLYDSIGKRYTSVRREDPRIGARIRAALGDARTVVNVGAGTGAYEPADLEVTAVEPSEVMIAQRPEGAAPVVRAFAEELPFEDGSFDAAMAVLSDHHWSRPRAGPRGAAAGGAPGGAVHVGAGQLARHLGRARLLPLLRGR